MNSRGFANRIGNFFGVIESAVAVSAAVRDHRKARDADLERLGIDPKHFHQMRQYY